LPTASPAFQSGKSNLQSGKYTLHIERIKTICARRTSRTIFTCRAYWAL
jgi:hypothetical protein